MHGLRSGMIVLTEKQVRRNFFEGETSWRADRNWWMSITRCVVFCSSCTSSTWRFWIFDFKLKYLTTRQRGTKMLPWGFGGMVGYYTWMQAGEVALTQTGLHIFQGTFGMKFSRAMLQWLQEQNMEENGRTTRWTWLETAVYWFRNFADKLPHRPPRAAGKILWEGVGIAQLWQRPCIWCDAFSTIWMPSWAVKWMLQRTVVASPCRAPATGGCSPETGTFGFSGDSRYSSQFFGTPPNTGGEWPFTAATVGQ